MIIALTGTIGSGKDTVSKMIQYYFWKEYNSQYTLQQCFLENDRTRNWSGWQIKKFASKLKQICSILLNCKVEDFEDSEFKNSRPAILEGKSVRWLLQHTGTEFGRAINSNIWIESLFAEYIPVLPTSALMKQLGKLCEEKNMGLIDYNDKEISKLCMSYFPNWIISDLRFLNEAKAIKDRYGIIIKLKRTKSESSHSSETELSQIEPDFEIDNTGTLAETYNKLKIILDGIN